MAITGSGWPGGYLSMDMVLQGIGDNPGSQVDMVTIGALIGATDGVVGSGDEVILPTDFWGQDVNKTATTITLANGSTQQNFTTAAQAYTLNVSSNGVGKLDNIAPWVNAAVTYFTNNTTNISTVIADNSALGSPQRTFTLNGVGSGNSILDTVDFIQAGNPASVTITSPSFSTHTATGTQFSVTKSSNTNFVSVTVGNSDLTLTLLSTPNSNKKVYGIEWTSGPSYSLSALTTTVSATVSDVNDANSTLTENAACNVGAYNDLALTGIYGSNPPFNNGTVDKDGETNTFQISGEAGATYSISITDGFQTSYTIDGVSNATTGTVGDVISMTWPVNLGNTSRSMTINVTDTTSGNAATGITFTQSAQIIANFEVKETGTTIGTGNDTTSHTYDWNGGAKVFEVTCQPNGTNSAEVYAQLYNTDFKHGWGTSPSTPPTLSTAYGVTGEQVIFPQAQNGYKVYYWYQPQANNTSITDDIGPRNQFIQSRADQTKLHLFKMTQSAKPVQYSWYWNNTSNTFGESQNNPIGPNTSNNQAFRIYSTVNDTTQGFRISGSGTLEWNTNPGGASNTWSNPFPSYNTYWTPSNWSYNSQTGYYYTTFYARRTGTSYSCSYPQMGGFYLTSNIFSATGGLKFQATPTSSGAGPMGNTLWVCN